MPYSPQDYDPGMMNNTPGTKTWTTTGLTDVVTDSTVQSNSIVVIVHTSAYAGRWSIALSKGVGFTVTSSDSETQTTTTYSYIIL